jgi:hypothetical protein
MTFLISPVSSPERIQQIDTLSTDFSYALAVNATTGTAKLSNNKTYEHLERLSCPSASEHEKEICSRLWDSNAHAVGMDFGTR